MFSSDKIIPLQYFSVFLKFWACYVMGQWGEFEIKNATLCLHLLFWHLLLFLMIPFVFLSFLFLFFGWSIKFPQQNNSQSETGIDGPKLFVKLTVSDLISPVFWLSIWVENLILTVHFHLMKFKKFLDNLLLPNSQRCRPSIYDLTYKYCQYKLNFIAHMRYVNGNGNSRR